jgi:hypothetical protein
MQSKFIKLSQLIPLGGCTIFVLLIYFVIGDRHYIKTVKIPKTPKWESQQLLNIYNYETHNYVNS